MNSARHSAVELKRAAALVIVIVLAVLARGAAFGQTFNDDFNDGNDAGWTRYNVLQQLGMPGTYTFPGGNSYNIESPQHYIPAQAQFGGGRAGSIVNSTSTGFDNFRLTVDVTDWNDGREYVFGPIARTTTPGLGTTDGYLLILHATDHDFQLLRIEGEAPNSEELGTADVEMPADRDFRIVYSGVGTQLNALVYNLADLSTPLGGFSVDAANYGPAPTPAPYMTGALGLIVAQADQPDDPAPPPGDPYAATFDNFRVVVPAAGEWNALGGGMTSAAHNWVGNVAPDGPGAHARFLGGAEVDAEVNIDTNFYTLGQITFDNANSYKLTGMPMVLQNTADAQINVLSGSHEIAADVMLSSNLRVEGNGTLTISGPFNWDGKSIAVRDATLRLPNVAAISNSAASKLTIGQESTVHLTGTTPALVVGELEITIGGSPTGKLDLGASAAIIDYTGTSPLPMVRSQILAGRGGAGLGAPWNGPGITSSTVADDNMENSEARSVGYAENSAMPLGPVTTFKGQPVDGTSVLMTYTKTADANLDGRVNDDDVTIVGATYAPGVAGAHWYTGDFDYNGFVDDDDVTLLGVFYDPAAAPVGGAPMAPGNSVAAVPEPTSLLLSVLGVVGIGIFVRRRRT
jgi:copper(I)-binding protein